MVQPSPWILKTAYLVILALILLGCWLVLRQLGLPGNFSPTAIAVWLGSQALWGPLLLGLLMIIAVLVGPIPTLPVSAASGLAFGLLGGTLIAASAALIGAMIAFWSARFLGRDALSKRLENNPLFAHDGSQRLLFWTVLLTRLVPLFSFGLISYGAGLTVIGAWRFALASFIGMLPMTLVFAGLGQAFTIHPALTVAAAALLLAAMTLLPWYLNRYHPTLWERWFKE